MNYVFFCDTIEQIYNLLIKKENNEWETVNLTKSEGKFKVVMKMKEKNEPEIDTDSTLSHYYKS